ncbi:MAG: hypothetical protein Q8Q87_03285 [Candidatus Omnitrophota bacterium]|nr:hypothetical protein [Candidatus Omnitrophota bacterium]
MRHARSRRRFKLILSMLLILCFILFIEERIEAFVPEVKNFAELKVEEALNGRVRFSIGSLEGGILNPITVNDIRIKDNLGSPVLPYLVISSIRTNYRIWDALFVKKDMSAVATFISGVSRVDANFATVNKEVSGFVRLENDSNNLRVTGYVNLLYEDRVDFNVMVKDNSFDIEIRPRSGTVKAEGKISEEGNLSVNFKTTHLKLGDFDIVCDGVLRNKITRNSGSPGHLRIEGEIETRNLLLNYRPFMDLKASYSICDGILEISNLALADIVRGRGKIDLSKRYNTDFTLTANNMSLSWFLLGLGVKDASSILTGTMNGKFDFKGGIENLRSDIELDIRKGTIAKLDFDYLNVHMKGDGPIIRIEDSRITRQSGYFELAGEMDLRKMGKSNLFDNIRIATDERAITWDDLDVTKVQGAQEVRMEKRLNDEINIDFKKFVTDEIVDESNRHGDEVRFEYKLHPNDSLKVMVGAEKDFFGFEHKDKF